MKNFFPLTGLTMAEVWRVTMRTRWRTVVRMMASLMASITITFFICWSPMVVYGFVHDFYREALPERDR